MVKGLGVAASSLRSSALLANASAVLRRFGNPFTFGGTMRQKIRFDKMSSILALFLAVSWPVVAHGFSAITAEATVARFAPDPADKTLAGQHFKRAYELTRYADWLSAKDMFAYRDAIPWWYSHYLPAPLYEHLRNKFIGEYLSSNKLETLRYYAAKERAISEYEKALSIKPDFPQARFNLALLYRRTSKLHRFRQEIAKFIKSAPCGPQGAWAVKEFGHFVRKK